MTLARLCLSALPLWLAGCALLPFGSSPAPARPAEALPAAVVVTPAEVKPAEPIPVAPVATQVTAADPLPPPPKPVAKAPAAKPAAPKPEVDCQSRRSGRGDDEKTTIRCTNHSAQTRTVFLKLDAIGVSGIPTVASEKAGHRLAAGETRVLATLAVISRPAQVRFSVSSTVAP